MANPFHLHNYGNFMAICLFPFPKKPILSAYNKPKLFIFSILESLRLIPLWHPICSNSY
jgi:hypothetical protein